MKFRWALAEIKTRRAKLPRPTISRVLPSKVRQKSKKKFYRLHEELSSFSAHIKQTIGVLDRYDENYKTLDRQYEKIKTNILRAEKSAMSSIVGEVIKNHPEITPSDAHAVMEEVLERRKLKTTVI